MHSRYLVLVTDDPDLLAVVPWIEGEVRIARDFDEASHQLNGSRGWATLALGWDAYLMAIRIGRMPNYPFCLLYADRAAMDWELVSRLSVSVWELPLELDFLHERLGLYKPARKNGIHC
jgi:hypothetical protein